MGARSGGGAGWRSMTWAMQGNSKSAHSTWSQAIQATTGRLVTNIHTGKNALNGAARKNALGTLKMLMDIHPTASFTKAIKSGKVVGFNPKELK